MVIEDLNQAIDVLIQSAAIGQSKGIYTIREAGYINAAIEYLEKLSGGPLQQEAEEEEFSDELDNRELIEENE